MAKNPFDDLVENPEMASSSSNPFESLATQEESKVNPIKAIVQQWGRKFLAHAAASPRTLAEGISGLAHLGAQKGIEQKIKKGEEPESDKFTENAINVLDFPKKVLQKFWPTPEAAEQGIKKFLEFTGSEQTPIEPQTLGQERAATVGEFGGSSVFGGPKKLFERLILGSAAGAGAQAGKETIGGAGGEITGALVVPAFFSLAYQIKKGKWNPSSKELQAFKAFGEKIGLTEAEITPLVQSEAKIATLGKVATGTSKSASALESAETKLTQAYQNLKSDAKSFPGLNPSQKGKMLQSFETIVENLKQSALPPDEKIKVIQKVENAINHFGSNGVNAASIIDTWQDINKTVNWKSYAGGKKDLAALKAPLQEALNDIDPKLAKDFENINALWGRMKNIGNKITDKDMKKWVDYGESFALLGSVVSAVATGNWKPLEIALGTVAARRLANKMLTDPKYQNIYRRSVNAIQSSSKAEGLKLLEELELGNNPPKNKQ